MVQTLLHGVVWDEGGIGQGAIDVVHQLGNFLKFGIVVGWISAGREELVDVWGAQEGDEREDKDGYRVL